eukprot:6842289-Pyramimonas_sp.AAC.1
MRTLPGRMRTLPLGASVELPMGPRSAVMGVKMQHWVSGTRADGGSEAFGGAPYGATKRFTGREEMPKQ